MSARITLLAYTDLARDPRLARQRAALTARHRLTVFGRRAKAVADDGVVQEVLLPPVGRWRLREKLAAAALMPWGLDRRPHVPSPALMAGLAARLPPPDLVIANDIEMLPLAFHIGGRAPVVFDAHEYYLDDQEPSLGHRLTVLPYLRRVCRRLLPRCAAMMTVGQGIAERYQREFAVAPVVVTNAPAHQDLAPRPGQDGRIRLIHHGNLLAGRRPEQLIEVMRHVDRRFHLTLMLMPGPPAAEARLRALVAVQDNVVIVPPVPMPEIATTLNAGFDLGIHVLPPASFNDRMALPNKFFEFIQARLGVIVGPSPEMARIVADEGIGVVASSFAPVAVAAALNALSEADIDRFKAAAHLAAAHHNAERNATIIRGLVERVLAHGGPSPSSAFD